MESIREIQIKDYIYDLPERRIAKTPLEKRDQSKLLVYRNGLIHHFPFSLLPDIIPENNLLVRNNTRVIQARLIFKKDTGASIEIFCLEPIKPAGYEPNFSSTKSVEWLCLVGNAKKWKSGVLNLEITYGKNNIILNASNLGSIDNNYLIRFEWEKNDISFADILEMAGSTPIPPYLNREAEERDKTWYQTVYARLNGSVAAPTAGLHFTEDVFRRLSLRNINVEEVTLHVGAGTFRPVQTNSVADHNMHEESLMVKRQSILRLASQVDKGITAVGTTSLRALESLYWLGLKINRSNLGEPTKLNIDQWDPYNGKSDLMVSESLGSIIDYMDKHAMEEIRFTTRLIIIPGYSFRMVNRLITNFHQPGSTLLLLVAAFIGNDWKKVYQYALENDFRFLSYGDSSLLELNTSKKQ